MPKSAAALENKNRRRLLHCALSACTLIFCPLSVWGQTLTSENTQQTQGPALGTQNYDLALIAESDRLFSPSVAQIFYEIAYEMVSENAVQTEKNRLSTDKAEQAITFLTATMQLDNRANYVLPDMIKLLCRYPAPEELAAENTEPRVPPAMQEALEPNSAKPSTTAEAQGVPDLKDRAQTVYTLLGSYVDESADLGVLRTAVTYLLEQLDSREQREELLTRMYTAMAGKNTVLESELAMLLALLMAEKTDLQTAQVYLIYAYNSNKYNKLAFAKLLELMPEQINPITYLDHLRTILGENPFSIEASLGFAQYTEKLQLYGTAADAYEYCSKLFNYFYPSQPLPPDIYLPWMLTSYNTPRHRHRSLQIASDVRQSGRFDLFSEAIAAKAAAKIGDTKQANRILNDAEDKMLEIVVASGDITHEEPQAKDYEQLAWFYCFSRPDADKAIDWANKAYSVEPNSATTAAILAYSLVMNGQTDWAKQLIDGYERNQIADLAMAQIQLAQEQKDSAIDTLKSVIASDPGSLEAEYAKEILARNGGDYIPPINPDIILTILQNTYGQTVVPEFITPEKVISAQLNLRGSKFSYGSQFDASVVITNNSSEPLVISDDGLFTGDIRVDAVITGDINKRIPNLVPTQVSSALPVEPGQSIFVPLRLVTGELRQILLTYPQASVDIELTLYLDPVVTGEGITNRLAGLEPATAIVKRPGVNLTGRYLQNRFSSLKKGQQGQKVGAIQLFTGLLAEQNAMANREPLYEFMYADWIPDLLKSAVLHSFRDEDWVTKVHTMAGMLALPLDYEMINVLAENLNDTHWPVRMMAIYLLAKNQDSSFAKVLQWTAKYDSNKLVRDMATALGTGPQRKVRSQLRLPETSQKNLM